ncbi:MAG: hypothetical protein Q9165_001833 [Trypethelium subeluteriae]
MSEAGSSVRTGWFSRAWPFSSINATDNNDSSVDTSSSESTEPLEQESGHVDPARPRTREVFLQHLDAKNNGTGELVSDAEAARMDLIWDLNQVRYPLSSLVKTPSAEDILALRNGVHQGIFQNALVRPPYGVSNPIDAAIFLTELSSGQNLAYSTDYLDEEPCELSFMEKRDRQIFFVFLKGEDLPSYHFWQDPKDPDPTQCLHLDKAQLDVLDRLVGQSNDRFQRMRQFFDTDVTNETKAEYAEETFGAVSEILGRIKVPKARDLSRKVHGVRRGLNAVGHGVSEELLEEDLGRPLFDVSVEQGAGQLIEEDERSDASSLLETSYPAYERPSAGEQHQEDDGINIYPHTARDDDRVEENEDGGEYTIPTGSGDIQKEQQRSPQTSNSPLEELTSNEDAESEILVGPSITESVTGINGNASKSTSRTPRAGGKSRKRLKADKAYDGKNDLPLSPSEVSPVLRRTPKRKSPDHPEASYRPEKKRRNRSSSITKEDPSSGLKRGVTRSGARFLKRG